MNIVRIAGAMLLGLLPLLVGCAQVGTDAGDEEVGTVKQAGGNGTQNGFDPAVAGDCWADINASMDHPVHVDGALNSALPASVRPPAGEPPTGGECMEAFDYALTCADKLTTAAGWLDSGGLDNLAKQEVMACMLGLVNPIEGIHVCISGEDVSNSAGACLAKPVEEAVWQTSINRDGTVTLHAWPLEPEERCTTNALKQVFASRLCGPNAQHPADCGVDFRADLATACSKDGDDWTCLERPAILTRLGTLDWLTLFPAPGCDPFPQ